MICGNTITGVVMIHVDLYFWGNHESGHKQRVNIITAYVLCEVRAEEKQRVENGACSTRLSAVNHYGWRQAEYEQVTVSHPQDWERR